MPRRQLICWLALVGLVSGAALRAAEDRAPAATAIVEALVAGRFAAVFERFDPTMRKALPAVALGQTWQGLLAQVGPFREVVGTRGETVTQGGIAYDVVFVGCRFERATLDAQLVFDPQGRVAGMFFKPASAAPGTGTAAAAYEPPAYVDQRAFAERPVTVGGGEWALPGTLAMPSGEGPFPALVLVHGSGPHDRDETIGPNRPFRDLAWGLASRGIAVLRYDKRTLAHREAVAELHALTVQEETVDDAVAAAALLRATGRIDPRRVFLLGHSLGGMLVPRIGRRDPALAGMIVLAGAARPIEELIVEQLDYLTALGTATPADREAAAAMRAEATKVRALDPAAAATTEVLLGAPVSYWLDLRGYEPAREAAHLPQRLLILQGGRDYQVTAADFALWQAPLAHRRDVAFRLYPDLNHLFATGKGKATPAEYELPGHVAATVIADIAAWILGGTLP